MSRTSDEWSTPPDVWRRLHMQYQFDLDAAARPVNATVPRWLGPGGLVDDALAVRWATFGARIWCNPPYSRLADFLAKGHEASQDGAVVVFLIPARTDTRAWHRFIWDAQAQRPRADVTLNFLPGRLKFSGSATSAPFPSAVVVMQASAHALKVPA